MSKIAKSYDDSMKNIVGSAYLEGSSEGINKNPNSPLKYKDYSSLTNSRKEIPVISLDKGTRELLEQDMYSLDKGSAGALYTKDYGGGWGDSFLNKVFSFRESRYAKEAADFKAQLYDLNKRLKELDPDADPVEKGAILEQLVTLNHGYRAKLADIRKAIYRQEQFMPSTDYLEKELAMQADPGTGTNLLGLFKKDEADVLDYLKYELPGDLAGSYSEIGLQLLSTFGPMALQRAAAAATASLKVPGPWQAVITGAVVAGSLFASAKLMQEQREREAAMEAGDAYKKKLNESINQFYAKTGKMPTDEQVAEMENEAYKGLEQIMDVTRNQLYEDYAQVALSVLPWTKIGSGLLGAGRLATAFKATGSFALNAFTEGMEESRQFIVQKQYEEGTLPETTDTFEYWWDSTKESTRAMFGVGDPDLMSDEEWGNSVRAGALLGGGHHAIQGGLAVLYNNVKGKFTEGSEKKMLQNILLGTAEKEHTQYRATVLGKFIANNKVDEYYKILENIKDSKFAEEHGITSEQIDEEIEQSKRLVETGKFINGQEFKNLSSGDKMLVMGELASAQGSIKAASASLVELEDSIDTTYNNSDIQSAKGVEFVRVNRLRNKLNGLIAKKESLSKLPETAISSVKELYETIIDQELTKASKEYEEALTESGLKDSELSSVVDNSIMSIEAKKIDALVDKKLNEQRYDRLTNAEGVRSFIDAENKKSKAVQDQIDKDIEKEVSDQISKAEESTGKAAIVYDDSGAAYKLVGRDGDKFKVQDVESGNEFEISKEEAEQVGMKLADNDQPIDDIVLFTNKAGKEYAYVGKEGNKYFLNNLETGKLEEFTARKFKQAGFIAREELLKESNKALTPEQIADKEDKEKADRAEAVKAQKQAILSTLMGEDGKVMDEATLAEMDRLIKENGTFFNIVIKGAKLTIEGKELSNNNNRPTDAIIKDTKGNPVAIVLTDSNGKAVKLINKYLVADLATTIASIENARLTLFKMLRESKEAFLIFKGPESKYEYYVYLLDGEYVVLNPKTGKRASRDINNRVINQFLGSLDGLITKASDIKRVAKEQGNKLTTKELKDELKRIDSGIRRGTPEEIINAKSAGEIPVSERPAAEEPKQIDKQTLADKKADIERRMQEDVKNIVNNRQEIEYETTIYDQTADGNKRKVRGKSPIIDLAGRKVVVLNVNGMNIPFYLSTGHGGKADVTSGKWYPIFGIAQDGWMNKLSGNEINNYYDSKILKLLSEELDTKIGDIRNDNSIPKAGISGSHIDFINRDLTPTENGLSTTRDVINKNIENVKNKINAKYDAELATLEKQTTKEQDITSTTEEGIINTKAEELINSTSAPQPVETSTEPDTDRIEPNELSLPSNILSDLHGLKELESSLAYNADDQPAFDKWISNPNLSLEGYYVEFEVDYSINAFWNEFPELKSAMRNGRVADSDRSAIFATSKAVYNHFIDQVPIKAVLKDKDGNAVKEAGLYIHRSDFGEIQVPTELINDEKAKADYRLKEREKLRNRRKQIITDIINGNRVTAGNLKRTKGKPNSRPAGIVDRLSNLKKVFKEFTLAVADSNRIPRKKDGTPIIGRGNPGNVFAEVKALNGELFNLKLNPARLSEQHARIVLSALLQAYKSKDGYSTIYNNNDTANRAAKSDVVGDLTVGEVLYYLVLEGKNFTDQSIALHPKAHLKAKQLWVEERVLHYGVDGLLKIDELTEASVNKFLRWATGNKNYVLIKNSLGSTINRTFKIGNLSVKAGQTYDSFILDNGLVQTDVDPELPFHAPVVVVDFNSYSATGAKAAAPKQAPVVTAPTTVVTPKPVETEKPKVDVQAVLKNFDLSNALQKELNALNATLNPRLANYEFGLHVSNGLYTGGMFLTNNANGVNMELGDAISDPNMPQKLKNIIGKANAELSKALSTGVKEEPKVATKPATKSARDIIDEISPFGAARAVSYAVGSYTPMDSKKAVEWLKKRLPKGVSVELIDTFIKLGDTQAFGLAKPYAVILAEAAEVGSEYHEAFHEISLGVLTPRERMLVYDKARKIYGLDEMSDKAVEEYLAERFREFVIAEDKSTVSLSTTIRRFFQKLFDFIYTFFTGDARLSDYEISTVFDAINRGAYKYVKPTNTGFETYSPAGVIRGRTGFKAANAKTIVKNIVYFAFKLNNVTGVKDVDKIKFAPVKDKFIAIRDAHKSDMDRYRAEGNEQLAAVSEDLYNKFLAITDPETWQAFTELADDYLLSLKIRSKDIDIEASTDPEDNEETKNGDQATENNLDKKSYETDLKDNMLAAMKMLIMTLPESTEHDPFTQLFSFVDFAGTWSSLIYDLHKHDNIEDMVKVLKAKGKNILAYSELAKKLEAKGAENLRTQFEVSFRKYRHAFIDWTYEYDNGTNTLKSGFQSSDVQNAAKLLTKEWGIQFAKSGLIDEKTRALNLERMRHIFREYKDVLSIVKQATDKGLPYDYADASERIIKIFNELSIPLDQHVLAFIMADKEQFVTKEQAFADFVINDISTIFGDSSTLVARAKNKTIKNNKGQILKDEDIFNNEKAIRVTLAGYYIKAKPDELLTTILGPDGNVYYVYANNSVIADNVRELQNNADWSKSLLGVAGNNNSVFLKQIVGNESIRKSINLKTSSNFVRLGVADAGKDYSALNDTEDMLFKLDAIHKGFKSGNSRKGYLPLPSLADRTTYQLLDGLELPEFKPVLVNGKIVLPRESEAVNVLLGYIKDEMARIQLAKEQIEEALEKKDTSKLVENFHYKVKTRDKLKGAKVIEKIDDNLFKVFKSASGEYVGNGTKFMHFGDLNNKSVDITNDQALRSYVIKHLVERISDTIKYAADLGLITAHVNNAGFWVVDDNRLIDTDLVNTIASKEFGGLKRNAIYKILGNYTLNTIVSSIETEKMFIGDMAYFKDDSIKATAEDKIKRLSVLMSTGDNLRTLFPEKHELYGKTSYNSAFLNSNIITSVWYDNLYEAFVSYYEKSGMTKEQAKEEAKAKLFKYRKVDQTDAQAYVTADMYRSIQIRLGEWDADKQKAFDLLQSTEVLSREKELEALNLVMPPLKLVSFGKIITDNLAIPTFDKMSMAPLFRRMVRDTVLEDLVDRMEVKNAYEGRELEPIDMIRFDTATKVGNRDRKAFIKKDGTSADLGNIKIFPQQFKDLRRQQITDPHDVERSLLGTQVRKVVMSNIELDEDYTFKGESIKGKDLANIVMDCMNKLSTIGKEKMMKDLGIEFKEGRHMISNKAKLFKTLLEDAKRSGMADNVIESLQVNIDGQPYLPIDAMPDRKWVQSRLISAIAKYTVDLKLPGNSFIQMSNYGYRRKLDVTKDLEKHGDVITWLKEGSRDLKFYRVRDGRTQPMECVVSVSLFKHVIPNYDKLTFGEKVEFVKNNPLILGYRIPTQGMNSVSVLKVVGLLPEQIGDTIMLPAEFTALTGSDFDIDKLYAVRYNYVKDASSPGNVRRVSSNSETREGIENRLLDAYFSILLDPKHFTQLTTPLDAATEKIKDIASNIEKLEGRDFIPETMYIDSPVYQSLVKSKYIGGKSGIGPFALNNVHHVLGQLTGLYFKGDIGVGNVDQAAEITRLDGKKGIDGEYILDWLSALINAHVDIAKDPYVFDLNVNAYTYNVTNFLIRAGVGGEKTFYFLAQPILKELSKLGVKKKQEGLGTIEDSEYTILVDKYKDLRNKALYKAGKKLEEAKEEFKAELNKSADEGLFNIKTLTKDIAAKGEGDYLYYMRQLAILNKFKKLNNDAFSLNNVVMFSRIDTKKYGNNLTDVELYSRGVDKILDDKKMGNIDRLLKETFLETYYDNNIRVVQDIFKDITIAGTDTFYKVVDMITKFSGATDPNSVKKVMSTVSDALLTNVAAKFFADSEVGLGMTKEKVKKLFYSNDGLIDKIAAIRSGSLYPELKDNRLIKILRTEIQEEGSAKPNIIRVYSTNIKEKWDKDDISRAWEDLINHENEEIRKIGRGLVIYAFYTSGFKKNIYSFFQFIPTSYLHDIGYGDHMNSYLNNLNNEANLMDLFNYVEEIFVNGWNHKHLVPVFNGFRQDALAHKGRELMFKMSSKVGEDYLAGFNKHKEPIFRPYIKLGSYKEAPIYKYIGYVIDPATNDPSPVYLITSKKSYYDAGVVIIENMLNGTIFTSNDPGLTAEELKSINAHLTDTITTPKNYNNKYKGFKSMSIENMIIDEEVTKTIVEERIKAAEEAAAKGEEEPTELSNARNISGRIVAKIPMNFRDGMGGRKMRPEFKGKSTMDLILSGDRTATSRDMSKEYNRVELEVGDLVQFYDDQGRTVTVMVSKPFRSLDDILVEPNEDLYHSIFSEEEQQAIEKFDAEAAKLKSYAARYWSALEGWDAGEFYRLYENGNYEQMEFTLVSSSTTGARQLELDFGNTVPTIQTEQPATISQEAREWYALFWTYVKKGRYQQFIRDLKKAKNTTEINNINNSIRNIYISRLRKDFPMLGKIELSEDGSTVLIENDSIIKEAIPTFERVMVGNHGIYIEFNKPSDKGSFIKKHLQYNEYNKDGVKYYDQTDTVNYADYKIGKWYADMYDVMDNKQTEESPFLSDAEVAAKGVDVIFSTEPAEVEARITERRVTQGMLFNIPIDTSNVINVYAGTGENAHLSNFATRPFELTIGDMRKLGMEELPFMLGQIGIKSLKFNSVEQFFQISKYLWSKSNYWEVSDKFVPNKNDEIAKQIMTSNNAKEIKKLGRQFDLAEPGEFDKVSSDIMKLAVKESFIQNKEAYKQLLLTGNKKIMHLQDTTKWREEFPRILEEVRYELGREVKKHYPELTSIYFGKAEESPFLSDAEIKAKGTPQVMFSTEPAEVEARIKELGIVDFNNITDEQMKDLRDKYAHCK